MRPNAAGMVLSPLFGGVPGGPELLIILLLLVVPVGIGIYVYRDAIAHGESESIAALWALAVAFGTMLYVIPGVIALAAYRWTHAGEPVA